MLRTQQLVDLAAVEQVARALGRDLGVVRQDDRRRQHGVALARLADQHRPGAVVLAALGLGAQLVRRVGQRHELAALDLQDGVGRAEGLPQRLLAVVRGERVVFEIRTVTPVKIRRRAAPMATSTTPASAPPAAHERARGCPPVVQPPRCSPGRE